MYLPSIKLSSYAVNAQTMTMLSFLKGKVLGITCPCM